MAVTPKTFVASPFQGARGLVIAPFQFETTADDNLQVVSANSLAGVVIAIQGRRRTEDGSIEPFAFVHTPNADRSTKTQNYPLGAGALLNLVIFASSGAPMIGQTYVMARLIRGLSGATIVLGALLGGYVTAAQLLAYPGSPIQTSFDSPGLLRTIVGTDPAAGNDWSEVAPSGARWEIVAARMTLNTSATVANRIPGLAVRATAGRVGIWYALNPLTAGSSAKYNCGAANVKDAVNAAGEANIPIPIGCGALAGAFIESLTGNLQAGDDWDAPILTVREWLEVAS